MPIQSTLGRWLEPALSLLFPPLCAGCARAGVSLCAHCAQAVEPVPLPICPRCGRATGDQGALCSLCQEDKTPVLNLVRAAALHISPLRAIVHQLKYQNRPELAEPLARYLVALFTGKVRQEFGAIDWVIPVPMYAERQRARGYNQAELLAAAFCRTTHMNLECNALRRHRFVRQQVGLNARERVENVADSFTASPQVAGKSILLVDDIYTTGATLRACAVALLDAGATRVSGLALAIPPSRESETVEQ